MLESKKTFSNPVFEMIPFTVEDIIATSNIRTNWDTDEFAFNNDSE